MPNNVANQYLSWRNDVAFDFPGYNNGKLIFIDMEDTSQKYEINFLLSPTNLNVNKSSVITEKDSLGGHIVQQFGPYPDQVSISGHLLDAKNLQESLQFIKNFKKLMTVVPSMKQEFNYKYRQYIDVEGMRYYGKISQLNLSKSGTRPFLYDFSLSFIALASEIVFTTSLSSKIKKVITNGTGDTPANKTGITMNYSTTTKSTVF